MQPLVRWTILFGPLWLRIGRWWCHGLWRKIAEKTCRWNALVTPYWRPLRGHNCSGSGNPAVRTVCSRTMSPHMDGISLHPRPQMYRQPKIACALFIRTRWLMPELHAYFTAFQCGGVDVSMWSNTAPSGTQAKMVRVFVCMNVGIHVDWEPNNSLSCVRRAQRSWIPAS